VSWLHVDAVPFDIPILCIVLRDSTQSTAAKAIGAALHASGLLARPDVVAVSALKMTAGHVGQTKDKVAKLLESARGGVLLIDEAYELGNGSEFMKEAETALVEHLTLDEYKDGKTVFILAGYTEAMERMFENGNDGLMSRFEARGRVQFHDWDEQTFASSVIRQLTEAKFCFRDANGSDESAAVEQRLLAAAAALIPRPKFGNGRDAESLARSIIGKRDARVAVAFKAGVAASGVRTIQLGDIDKGVAEMLAARPVGRSSGSSGGASRSPSQAGGRQPVARAQANQQAFNFRQHVDAAEPVSVQEQEQEHEHECHHDHGDEKVDAQVDVLAALRQRLLGGKRPEVSVGSAKYDEFLRLVQEQEEAEQRRQDRIDELKRLALKRGNNYRAEAEAKLKKLQEQLANAREEERKRIEAEMKRLEEERRRAEQEAAERRALEEQIRRQQETARKLAAQRPCPMGYSWVKVPGGWQCTGGSHYKSDAEAERL
jgi:hypothetical protein